MPDSILVLGRVLALVLLVPVLQADPLNASTGDLAHLCARTLWESPLLDERGFHCSQIGGGFSGMNVKLLSPRFYPDACARGFSLTGELSLLERAHDFWYYGSKEVAQRD